MDGMTKSTSNGEHIVAANDTALVVGGSSKLEAEAETEAESKPEATSDVIPQQQQQQQQKIILLSSSRKRRRGSSDQSQDQDRNQNQNQDQDQSLHSAAAFAAPTDTAMAVKMSAGTDCVGFKADTGDGDGNEKGAVDVVEIDHSGSKNGKGGKNNIGDAMGLAGDDGKSGGLQSLLLSSSGLERDLERSGAAATAAIVKKHRKHTQDQDQDLDEEKYDSEARDRNQNQNQERPKDDEETQTTDEDQDPDEPVTTANPDWPSPRSLYALRNGITNEHGDSVFFLPSFVEENPWGRVAVF